MKKIIISIIIISLLTLCIVGCTKNESDDDKHKDIAIWVRPTEFTFLNTQYELIDNKNDYELDTLSFTIFVGYIINTKDSEKWKAEDNDENINYALCDNIGVYVHSTEEKNRTIKRFELFSNGTDNLFLKVKGFSGHDIYKKVEEKINND